MMLAASGLKDFDLLLNEAVRRAPIGKLVKIMDVGSPARSSPSRTLVVCPARRSTSTTGVNIMA